MFVQSNFVWLLSPIESSDEEHPCCWVVIGLPAEFPRSNQLHHPHLHWVCVFWLQTSVNKELWECALWNVLCCFIMHVVHLLYQGGGGPIVVCIHNYVWTSIRPPDDEILGQSINQSIEAWLQLVIQEAWQKYNKSLNECVGAWGLDNLTVSTTSSKANADNVEISKWKPIYHYPWNTMGYYQGQCIWLSLSTTTTPTTTQTKT